ncbi:MAG: phenylacetate--CoA ligase family protein [Burkholderiales bacterium]|nr:phenylacetate--CoA ligase family protein [Burkholderiales bacterium]
MPTSLTAEQSEQSRWRLRAHVRHGQYYDALVRNEFAASTEQHARLATNLERVLGFAAACVPYYRAQWRSSGISWPRMAASGDLSALPVLTKSELRAAGDALAARVLPAGEHWAGQTSTSGTTGQPVHVRQSRRSLRMFSILKQRELRWFRYDPLLTLGAMRRARELPPDPTGAPVAPGIGCRVDVWPLIGSDFETGGFVGFDYLSSIEQQIDWLTTARPAYLVAKAATLEHLALAWESRPAPSFLRGVESITSQLWPDARRRIRSVLGVDADENYGLNEVGIVASRCPEGGRFHVHAEHCLIEIVDADGHAVEPGKSGRVLVTALSNLAMPLIRYDTGDLALRVEAACPCGRTLPSFTDLVGRYRNFSALPEGTLRCVMAVREALEHAPIEVARGMRQYQLHQARNGVIELRVVARECLTARFREYVGAAFDSAALGLPFTFRIERWPEIAPGPGGKFQDFVSDYFPPHGAA